MVYEIVVAGDAEPLVRVALHEPALRRDVRGTVVMLTPRDHAELVGAVNRLHDVGVEILQIQRLAPSIPGV